MTVAEILVKMKALEYLDKLYKKYPSIKPPIIKDFDIQIHSIANNNGFFVSRNTGWLVLKNPEIPNIVIGQEYSDNDQDSLLCHELGHFIDWSHNPRIFTAYRGSHQYKSGAYEATSRLENFAISIEHLACKLFQLPIIGGYLPYNLREYHLRKEIRQKSDYWVLQHLDSMIKTC